MKTNNTSPTSRSLHLIAVGVMALAFTTTAFAQGTTAFTYQGRLNDGASPATGIYDLQFTIYDAASGGNAVAGPITHSPVSVTNGLFTTTLDFGGGVFTGDARWLDLAVKTNGAATFTALTARQPLTPAPYAIFAANTATLGGQGPGAYVGKSGDTMTGALHLPANGLVAGSGQLALANGKVGIGTTSPQATLNVMPSAPFDGIFVGDDATTGATGLAITLSSLTNGYADIQAVRGQGLAWGDIVLNHYGGNVGIGTTNPAAKLEVDGTVRATEFQGIGSGLTGISGSSIASGTISAGQLQTANSPSSSQVLSYNGSSLAWVNPATVGGSWLLGGNASTGPGSFLGTTDNQPLEFKVNNQRALRLEPNATSPNVIGGYAANAVSSGVVGATISGGGAPGINYNWIAANFASIGGGFENSIWGPCDASTIGGGQNNWIWNGSGGATIAGGAGHVIGPDAYYGSIGGGLANKVLGPYGTVPGGGSNECAGYYSFAAGYRAKARHTGSFVWGDSTAADFASTGSNQFCIRAGGGVRLSGSTPALSFGTTARQMLNLWGTQYGIGVQSATVYFRSDNAAGSANGFAWYKGGTHNDAAQNPGGGTTMMTLDGNGLVVNGTARVCVLQITNGCDIAEPFELSDKDVPKGAVVVIDDENPGRLKMSDRACDTRVAGIISGANGIQPGLTLSQQGVTDGGQNVALSGRVYVQADATNDPIKPGDLLTTSDMPGYAMKVTNHAQAQGAILGKAMSSLKEGQGMVLVLVSLQ